MQFGGVDIHRKVHRAKQCRTTQGCGLEQQLKGALDLLRCRLDSIAKTHQFLIRKSRLSSCRASDRCVVGASHFLDRRCWVSDTRHDLAEQASRTGLLEPTAKPAPEVC